MFRLGSYRLTSTSTQPSWSTKSPELPQSFAKPPHTPEFSPEELYRMLTEDPNGPAKNTVVTSAWYCKRPRSAKHEYIVLEVEDLAVEGFKNYLSVDRNDGGRRSEMRGANPFKWHLTTPAKDAFKVLYDWDEARLLDKCQPEPHRLLARINFSLENPLLLQDLATLVFHISSQHPRYHPLDANCYWFAELIWACMRKMRPTAVHKFHAATGRFAFVRYHPNPLQVRRIVRAVEKQILDDTVEDFLPEQSTTDESDCIDIVSPSGIETISQAALYAYVPKHNSTWRCLSAMCRRRIIFPVVFLTTGGNPGQRQAAMYHNYLTSQGDANLSKPRSLQSSHDETLKTKNLLQS